MSDSKNKECDKIKNLLKLTEYKYVRLFFVVPLIFLNLGIVALIADPFLQGDLFSRILFNIGMPIIIISDLWSIRIMINPKKRIIEYELSSGIVSFMTSLVIIMIGIKSIYTEFRVAPVFYIVFSLSFYFLVLILLFRLFFKAIDAGHYSKDEVAINYSNATIVGVAAALGPVLIKIISELFGSRVKIATSSIVFLLGSTIFTLWVPNVYKYYLLKKYKDYVHFSE